MKTATKIIALLFLGMTIACSDDDTAVPEVINEEEVVTTVELTITDTESNEAQIVSWADGVNTMDNKPKIALAANKSYTTSVRFLNASNPDDIENITEEVIEEKDEHLVFLAPENTLTDFVIASNPDADAIDSNNIGINVATNWTTKAASTGTLTVFLIHQPTSKTGTTRSAFGGETEAEAVFDVTIE